MNTDRQGGFGAVQCAHRTVAPGAVIGGVIFPGSIRVNPCPSVVSTASFPLKKVASAILADVEPGFPARRMGRGSGETSGDALSFCLKKACSGRLEAALYGRQDARRYLFRHSLNRIYAEGIYS